MEPADRTGAAEGAEGNGEGLAVVEQALARLAILEDVGEGDLTASVVPESVRAEAVVRARAAGVLSGVGVATAVFHAVDPGIEVTSLLEPGGRFTAGQEILRARGSARSLLTAERSALNFLQHLSGVATLTARFVEAVAGTQTRITDTRKTVPGLRLLEKEAVLHGGGVNHRLGLYDAVMIKDNHVDAVGGIASAVEAARRAWPRIPIIVEARSRAEAEEAARCAVGRILLDNLPLREIAACVGAIDAIASRLPEPTEDEKRWRWLYGTWRPGDRLIQIEVSGGIRLENARAHALPGVDFLAVGGLTHSAPACDLAMELGLLSFVSVVTVSSLRPVRLESVGSTQEEARARAAEGAPSGTVILAEEQTAGRGRLERTWASAPGLGLWMTLIHRSGRPVAEWPALTACGCLAVCRTLEAMGFSPSVKWPNDVMLGRGKAAGLLADTEGSAILLGIGLNVLHRPEDFPEEIRDIATSVRMEAERRVAAERAGEGERAPTEAPERAASGVPEESDAGRVAFDRETILSRLLLALSELLAQFEREGPARIVAAVWERSAVRGKRLMIELPSGERLGGRAVGLGPIGELLLAGDAGEQRIATGTVIAVEES